MMSETHLQAMASTFRAGVSPARIPLRRRTGEENRRYRHAEGTAGAACNRLPGGRG